MMRKILFLLLIVFVSTTNTYGQEKNYDWSKLIDAIAQVESGGNPNARGGASIGLLQITPICVKECNEILSRRGSKKRYTLNDRWNVAKSKEMFVLIQSEHNKNNSIERAIKIWNGGPYYDKIKDRKRKDAVARKVVAYYNKVMKHFRK